MVRPSRTLHRESATAEDYKRIKEKSVLNVDEAAVHLNLSRQTLRRLTRAGVIPSFKLGRYLNYSRVALDELVARKGGFH